MTEPSTEQLPSAMAFTKPPRIEHDSRGTVNDGEPFNYFPLKSAKNQKHDNTKNTNAT